jgi:acyl carrier protein
MEEAAIYERLTKIFRDIFADDQLIIKPNTTAKDIPGWDSTVMITIILAVQEKFNIRLRSRDVDQLSCVADLVAILKDRG